MGRVSIKEGDKFNRLTIICRVKYPSVKSHFACKCDCGNYSIVETNQLKSGKTKSCGCYHSEISSQVLHDLKIGQPANNREQFTYLQEIGNGFKYICDDHTEGKYRYCKFLCPICNQEYLGRLSNVKSGVVRSCGCQKQLSFGASKIKDILEKNNINFKQEYTFEDCKYQKTLPFDFYFWFNGHEIIIEFDGSQHFQPKWNEKDFKETQIRDKIKNE